MDQNPSFFRGTVWGQPAEHVAESLSNGDRVVVIGQLVTQAWENEAGEKRSRLDVRVQAIGPDLTFVTAKITKATAAVLPTSAPPPRIPMPPSNRRSEPPF